MEILSRFFSHGVLPAVLVLSAFSLFWLSIFADRNDVVRAHSDSSTTFTLTSPHRGSVSDAATAATDSSSMGLCASAADHDDVEVKKAAAGGAAGAGGGTPTPKPSAAQQAATTSPPPAATTTPATPTGGLVAQAIAKAEPTTPNSSGTPTAATSVRRPSTTGGGGLVAQAIARAQAEKDAAEAEKANASRRPASTTRATTIGQPSPKCPICNQPGNIRRLPSDDISLLLTRCTSVL